MNIILIMVMSVNGKITQGSDPDVTHWTSPEDQNLFSRIKKHHSLIVMGRHTYEANHQRIHLSEKILRIVLTKHPDNYKHGVVSGQLEFSDEQPKQLLERLESMGFTTMLLLGGSEINSSFLKAGLVDELHLTIEPQLFGSGKNLLSEIQFTADMKLVKIKKLNTKGTLHLIYKIL